MRELREIGTCENGRRGYSSYSSQFSYTSQNSHFSHYSQENQSSLWITRPERSLGSNQVVFGGMMLPVSAMLMSWSMVTG